jgi:serine/threonine-protein kinase RsbW
MAGLRSSRPPPASAVQQWVVADRTQLRPLRTSLRETLDTQSLLAGDDLDDLVERMTIVASELSSNTLRHARSPAVVTLSRTRNAFVLDVADDQPSAPPRITDGSTGPGGRGLRIVQALALNTGWYATAGNKHVWAQFGVPGIPVVQTPRISVFDLNRFLRLFRRLRH